MPGKSISSPSRSVTNCGQFWSHSPRSAAVHRRLRVRVRARHGRWRTLVNAGQHFGKRVGGNPSGVRISRRTRADPSLGAAIRGSCLASWTRISGYFAGWQLSFVVHIGGSLAVQLHMRLRAGLRDGPLCALMAPDHSVLPSRMPRLGDRILGREWAGSSRLS